MKKYVIDNKKASYQFIQLLDDLNIKMPFVYEILKVIIKRCMDFAPTSDIRKYISIIIIAKRFSKSLRKKLQKIINNVNEEEKNIVIYLFIIYLLADFFKLLESDGNG